MKYPIIYVATTSELKEMGIEHIENMTGFVQRDLFEIQMEGCDRLELNRPENQITGIPTFKIDEDLIHPFTLVNNTPEWMEISLTHEDIVEYLADNNRISAAYQKMSDILFERGILFQGMDSIERNTHLSAQELDVINEYEELHHNDGMFVCDMERDNRAVSFTEFLDLNIMKFLKGEKVDLIVLKNIYGDWSRR